MITPVTPNLAAAMNRTSVVLGTIERRQKKLNDRDTYSELANQLEDLTVNILQASSSLSLIGVRPMGARFDFGPDTKLAAKVSEVSSYLRNDATNLLKANGFSAYESMHADAAVDRIKALYGLLVAAVATQVREDVRAISGLSPARLVAVAAYVADAADQGSRPEQQKPQPRG